MFVLPYIVFLLGKLSVTRAKQNMERITLPFDNCHITPGKILEGHQESRRDPRGSLKVINDAYLLLRNGYHRYIFTWMVSMTVAAQCGVDAKTLQGTLVTCPWNIQLLDLMLGEMM